MANRREVEFQVDDRRNPATQTTGNEKNESLQKNIVFSLLGHAVPYTPESGFCQGL